VGESLKRYTGSQAGSDKQESNTSDTERGTGRREWGSQPAPSQAGEGRSITTEHSAGRRHWEASESEAQQDSERHESPSSSRAIAWGRSRHHRTQTQTTDSLGGSLASHRARPRSRQTGGSSAPSLVYNRLRPAWGPRGRRTTTFRHHATEALRSSSSGHSRQHRAPTLRKQQATTQNSSDDDRLDSRKHCIETQ
jgi:hypothetical protein